MNQCFGDQAVYELSDGGLELSSFESGHQRHLSAQISCRFRPLSGGEEGVRHSSRGARAWRAFRVAPESAAPSP